MLLKFRFNNFGPFLDDASFSMIASGGKIKQRYPNNYLSSAGVDVLKTSVIVGENAGGKTNFMQALDYLRSFLFKNTDKPVLPAVNTVFFGNQAGSDNPSSPEMKQEFELEVIASDNCIYSYKLVIDRFGIVEENLFWREAYKRKPIPSFELKRDEVEELGEGKKQLSYSISVNSNASIQSLFENQASLENGLMANKLSLLGVEHVTPFVNWINDTLNVRCARIPLDILYSFRYRDSDMTSLQEILRSDEFFDIFRLVDSSIIQIEVSDEQPFEKTLVVRDCGKGRYSIALENDSAGVQQFFALSLEVYKVIKEHKVVFADELDSTLNPILTGKIINYINSFPDCGQFIFTTHNVTHLNLQTFMREQMYVVSKCKDTLESCIHCLSEYKELRYDSNNKIYEYYFKGLLGGVDNGQ